MTIEKLESLPHLPERPKRQRRLTEDEQHEQVEGVFHEWDQCQRCGLRLKPWFNANGNLARRHYVCPDEKRILRWFPARSNTFGEYRQGSRKPVFIGVMAGMRMAEIYRTRTGLLSFVYRLSFDGCVKMTWCGKSYQKTADVLRAANEIIVPNAQWERKEEEILPNEELKLLETGRKEEEWMG